jgi:hypothetical protein
MRLTFLGARPAVWLLLRDFRGPLHRLLLLLVLAESLVVDEAETGVGVDLEADTEFFDVQEFMVWDGIASAY